MTIEALGATVEHYRLVKPLGRGADSEVFLAVDTRTNRQVSLKLLMVQDRSTAAQRFERAAELWRTLNHRNIAGFVDCGQTHDGRHYIALEYIEGQNLDKVIKRDGPLELERALRLFRQLLLALRVAHRKGVLHRDIKPTNILVTLIPASDPRYPDSEQIKLIDFGLARQVKNTGGRAKAGGGVTADGNIVGTPKYMAPEQVNPNEGAAAASDIYGAALVLYEMITGREAVSGDNVTEVLYTHIQPGPTIDPHDPDLPAQLGPILAKATELLITDRYQSIENFLTALEDIHTAPTPSPRDTLPESSPPASSAPTIEAPPPVLPPEPTLPTAPALPPGHIPGLREPIAIPSSGGASMPTLPDLDKPKATPTPLPKDEGVQVSTTGSWRRIVRLFVVLIGLYLVSVVALWATQEIYLFRSGTVALEDHRNITRTLRWQQVGFKAKDGQELVGYFAPARGKGQRYGTVLVLHGLQSRPEKDAAALEPLRDQGLNVFFFGQRGYGHSEGWSSADAFFEDAPQAYDTIIGTLGAKPYKVWVLGRGVGASVAVDLAQNRKLEGLILEDASPSLGQRMAELMPLYPARQMLFRDFTIDAKGLGSANLPVLMLHGTDNWVAPAAAMQPLYGSLKGRKILREIKGAGHGELPEKMGAKGYSRAIAGFIKAFDEK